MSQIDLYDVVYDHDGKLEFNLDGKVIIMIITIQRCAVLYNLI